MAGQKFTLTFDAQLNVGQMKSAINNIQNELNRLQLPTNLTTGITTTLGKLEKSIRDFEVAASKDLSQKSNFSSFERASEKISSLFKDLQIQARDLGKNIDIEKLFPTKVASNIKTINNAIGTYEKKVASLESALERASTAQKEWKDRLTARESNLKTKQGNYDNLTSTTIGDVAKQNGVKQSITSYEELIAAIEKAEAAKKAYDTAVSNGERKANITTEAGLNNQITKLKATEAAWQTLQASIKTAHSELSNAKGKVTEASNKIAELDVTVKRLTSDLSQGQIDALKEVFTALESAGIDTSKLQSIEDVKTALQEYSQIAGNEATAAIQAFNNAINNNSGAVEKNTNDVRNATDSYKNFDNQVKDVSAFKSRIQYLLGINNVINLVRRGIRSAFNTIKDLDKVMTETAVVTNFTVSDMWKQLPEYTKRANELGVTTQQAYESATLFYQQGLNSQQAAALSTETLKMARIAGLDAAEATDRMTNALRGFNMELNATAAQRVDDVYSELAANTASNVDEISTAMTKVASLAHSANMEFETTAAFLSQIIETTRESAETAGTALKTVVARFSEVKKLVDTNQLKGTDEEGQVIDVNKVGAALRTAGIDLNKYFLGEVGLDDIFMELASKWDTLTSVQQRYIATQAAGSRQQSRFIALMQDYARTQELVTKAYNASGASARQFEKTQESLQSKLARLKNAWNEFLMGITNNVLVKSMVTALTIVLDFLNKISSTSSEVLNSFLKIGIAVGAFKGLKFLFKSGGFLDNILFNVTGGKGLTTGATKAGSIIVAAAQRFAAIVTGSGVKSSIGGSHWTGKVSEKATKKGAHLAGGNASLGITAAVAAAIVAFIALDHFTNEGVAAVRRANKVVERQSKVVEESKKTADKQRDAYNSYIKNQKLAKETLDSNTKKEAESEMAKAASTLAGINSKYVSSKNGEIIINLSYIEQEQKRKDEDAIYQQAVLDLAEARKAYADIGRSKDLEWRTYDDTNYNQTKLFRTKGGSFWDSWNNASWDYLFTDAETRAAGVAEHNLLQQIEQSNLQDQMISSVMAAAEGLLEPYNLDENLIQRAGYAYSHLGGGKRLSQSTNEQVQSDLLNLASIASSKNGQIFLDIINGAYNELVTPEQFQNIYESLRSQEKEVVKTLLDATDETISDVLNNYANTLIQAQTDFRYTTVKKLYKNGLKNLNLLDKVANDFNLQQVDKISALSNSLENYNEDFRNTLLTTYISSTNTKDEEKYADIFENITDNPILTLQYLEEQASQFDEAIAEIYGSYTQRDKIFASKLLELTKNDFQFSQAGQVQWFLADTLNDANNEIDALLEANGKLNSHNIQELAKNSKTLSTLLDKNVISANGLATAINALSVGKISIFDLNESILSLYDSVDLVSNAVERAGYLIQNFDPGEDWGDAYDFINTGIDKMSELINGRELGNPQLKNYLKTFFEVPPKTLEDMQQAVDLLKEMQEGGGADFWTKAIGFSMNDNGEIADMGVDAFAAQTEFASYRDYIKNLAKQNGYTNFSDDYYDLMIRNAANHDYGFLEDIAAQEVNKIIETYGKGLTAGEKISKADIQAIADAYGLDPQQILDAYTEKFNLDHIDFSKLEEKIRTNVSKITDFVNENMHQAFIDYRKSKGDMDSEINRMWDNGLSSDSTGFILSQLGIDSNGRFSIDTLYAEIGEIVPEVQSGSMSAADWVQEQIDNSPNGRITLPIDFNYQAKTDAGYETRTFHSEVEIDSVEGYQKAFDDAVASANTSSLMQPIKDAQSEADALNLIFESLGENTKLDQVTVAIQGQIREAEKLNGILGDTVNKTVVVSAEPEAIVVSGGKGSINFSIQAVAKGGIVKSLANGFNNILSSGLALTGEEAPEIIWNKEKGYAYLAGANGPEINNLQPGDQVFNGKQTKEILKRSGLSSFAKGTISSYDGGTIWNPNGGSNSGAGSNSSSKEDNKWKNEIDWLYNVVQNIEELERQQNKLQEKYDDLLADQTKTGHDLYKTLIEQMGNLYAQLDHQTYALEKREQEMREFMDTTNDMDEYLWYNWEDRTIEIDWDKIDQITDEEQYSHVKELIDQAEDIQSKMDDAEDAIIDINNSIQELENIWRDTFKDFEDRVLKAIVKMYQTVIDNYSELNDTLNNSNTAILEAINKEISLQRQIRDNTKTEEEIANNEAQLAYLRRDTTGGNDLAALQLEKSLADARQDYEDNLVDQAVQRLQDDNDAAAQQREKQIEIMQAQLDYQSENGEFNAYLKELLDSSMNGDGHLATDSDLYKLLAEQENIAAMTKVGKEVWEEELNGTFKEVLAYLLKDQGEAEGTYFTAVTAAFNGLKDVYDKAYHGSYSQGTTYYGSTGSNNSGDSSEKTSSNVKPKTETPKTPVPVSEVQRNGRYIGGQVVVTETNVKTNETTTVQTLVDPKKKHAKGGLNTTTGLAWLDGTLSEPEYVLNARQTEAFLKLADVLPAAMAGSGTTTNTTFGATTNNIVINVDKIDSDYSVDQMVDRVKEKLFESGSYRNNNVLNFLR